MGTTKDTKTGTTKQQMTRDIPDWLLLGHDESTRRRIIAAFHCGYDQGQKCDLSEVESLDDLVDLLYGHNENAADLLDLMISMEAEDAYDRGYTDGYMTAKGEARCPLNQ